MNSCLYRIKNPILKNSISYLFPKSESFHTCIFRQKHYPASFSFLPRNDRVVFPLGTIGGLNQINHFKDTNWIQDSNLNLKFIGRGADKRLFHKTSQYSKIEKGNTLYFPLGKKTNLWLISKVREKKFKETSTFNLNSKALKTRISRQLAFSNLPQPLIQTYSFSQFRPKKDKNDVPPPPPPLPSSSGENQINVKEKTEEVPKGWMGKFKKYGPTFLIYWNALYFGGWGILFCALEMKAFGNIDAIDLAYKINLHQLYDVSTISPSTANAVVSMIINEVCEVVRFPFVLYTFKKVDSKIKTLWPSKDKSKGN